MGEDRKHQKPSGLLTTSAYVGIGAGAIGSSIGSSYATLKGHPVGLWTAVSGIQCFVIGSTFWFSHGIARTWLESGHRREALSFKEELACSTVSGSVAGVAGGLLRGRANVIPGAIMCGIIGAVGQTGVSTFTASAERTRDRRSMLDRLSDSKWWPLKKISDAEYKQHLLQQIDTLNAELSAVDDQISALKQQRQEIRRKE